VAMPVRTDDTGSYRIIGLAPGSYVVSASTPVTRNGIKNVVAYTPTVMPGTTHVAEARLILVKAGETIEADFAMISGHAVAISGRALDSHGRAFKNVLLRQDVRSESFSSFGSKSVTHPLAHGTFVLRNVVPGDYNLAASAETGSAEAEVAFQPLTVDGDDVDGVVLTGSSGGIVKTSAE